MQKLKSGSRYALMIAITGLLLWLSLRGLHVEGENKFDYLWQAWLKSDKMYLWLMALAGIASHILRAMRWKMLLKPTGHDIKTSNSFWALMTGYLVNLAVPRGGEISRCYTLYQLEKTPVETSFGTVVTERIADVLCLLILIAFSFYLEWEKLKKFLDALPFSSGSVSVPWWVWAAALAGIVFLIGIYLLRKNEKFVKIIRGFKGGLLSVFHLEHKWLFIFYSFGIWALYFLMSYLVLMAFPETNLLGFRAVVTLFAVGSIAMATPLPGGAGSYHVLVPLALTSLYQVAKPDAVAFVFVFHAWQTLLMIVLGVISFVVSNAIVSKRVSLIE
ncbi:MAG: flippase-like domain-containing protein [Bacteroidetes bacterium]|nr:flippase-like domain-containing protein [Bacteroidota bacterium]MBS1540198.1 flippase-like domain-containing protein [Bacteroidota bacterium]